MSVVLPVLVVLLLVAVYTDIRWRIIPNWLVGLVLLLGGIHLLFDSTQAPLYLTSFAIGVVVWGSLFYLKAIGGGDAKLMMALSLFFVPGDLIYFYLIVSIIGAVQALVWWGIWREKSIPYGAAIALGVVLVKFTPV